MSEGPPQEESYEEYSKKLQESIKAGIELQEQDKKDPVRGPIVRLARKVFRGALLVGNEELQKEFEALRASFPKQFPDPKEAHRYRLYHYIIGSTPGGNTDLFDAEGEGSITEWVRELAQKYHIDTDTV